MKTIFKEFLNENKIDDILKLINFLDEKVIESR